MRIKEFVCFLQENEKLFWMPVNSYDGIQTSQLSRFGRETHDFLTDLTIACQSHNFSRFSRNIIIIVRLIRYNCHVILVLPRSWVLTVKFLIMKQHVMTNFELKEEWKA